MKSSGCPCLLTTPCHERCTCVTPLSSSGCSRCCSYGSVQQREERAGRLAKIIDRSQRGQRDGTVPSVHEMRASLDKLVEYADVFTSMLDELAMLRAKDRLRTDSIPPAETSDLPPDAATGLYLDVPFSVVDFEWLKMSFNSYAQRNDGGPQRVGQLMLTFAAIHRDERATSEFLRVMNTIILPLLRRLRLKEQPHLTRLGAAGE